MNKLLEKHSRLICILAPAIIGTIYIILCAANLQQSIWFDESFGAYLTRFDLSDIWNLTAVDVHPPLYYFLLKVWSGIFGYTDFAMRFMSVFFGATAIIFAWAWLKRKFGIKPALLATLLMALSPIMTRYGQEMRMYTLVIMLVFAATFVLQLAIDTRKRRYWVIYGILLSLGMWSHYFAALAWLAHLAYLIYTYRKKIFQKNIVIAYVTAIAVYLPWLPSFLSQSSTVQQGFWIGEPNGSTITDYFMNSFFYLDGLEIKGWLLLLFLVVIAAFFYLVVRSRKQLSLLHFLAFAPPIFLIILSLPPFKPMFVDRYVVYSSVTMFIIAGAAIMLPSSKKLKNPQSIARFVPATLAVLFLGTSIIGVAHVYAFGNFNKTTNGKSDAKTLYETVAAASDDGVPIITQNEWLYYDLSFYGTDEHPVYFMDEATTYAWGSHKPLESKDFGKIKDLDAFLAQHDKIWYVGDLPDKGDIEFVRENWQPVTEIILPVNVNQRDYQALELQNPDIVVQ